MGKKTGILGSILIVGLTAGLLMYQKDQNEHQIIAQTETVEQQNQQENISGYEDEENLVKYMLYQFQQQNLDLALRGCSIRRLAEGFDLQTYIEFTESFDSLNVIPAANWDSTAYVGISEMRLAGYYADWIQKCEAYLGKDHKIEYFSMEEEVPENPDGKYYEERRTICDILGARSVEEVVIYARIDGQTTELHWTLARFGKSWSVLLFTPLDGYGQEEPEIKSGKMIPEWESEPFITKDILPVNYGVANVNGEATPTATIQKFFMYLMRQDVWSAASYVKLYDGQTPHTTEELIKVQSDFAALEQKFYYGLFFPDKEKNDWYYRDLKTRAKDIVEDSRSDQIIMLNVGDAQLISEPSDSSEVYQLVYGYGKGWYGWSVTLVNENGWRITNIEWQ